MQVVGVMVAMGGLEDLRGHAQEPGGFPDWYTGCISQVAAVWRKGCGATI
jgi:hypothetical protein